MNIIKQGLGGARRFLIALVVERPAKRKGIDRLIQDLERSGLAIEKRIAAALPGRHQQELLAHLIGIERWGARRVRVALGEPLEMDEYDAYRPEVTDWGLLREAFHATRQETLSLSRSLRMAGIDLETRIHHNQMGEMSVLGWLQYLITHANFESSKIRTQS